MGFKIPQSRYEVAKDAKNVKIINNHKVIPIDIAVKNNALFLIPENILESCQYAAPLTNDYYPMEAYQDTYRGGVTFWKFNKEKGRILPEQSFTLELPPYMQDCTRIVTGKQIGRAHV